MALSMPIGINLLSDSTLVKKTDGIGKIRRGREILFIEKETASWIILSGAKLEFFNSIKKPITVGELKKTTPSRLSSAQKDRLLLSLFRQNMITLNGTAYYDPRKLWVLPQRYPAFLCFHITEACNFACKYCYARADQKNAHTKIIPREVTHRAIEKILEELPLDKLLIDFHGGEPFLAYEQMVDTIQYAHQYNEKRGIGKQLKFVVQSNGSLITPERAKFLNSLNCNIGISLDGPAEIHNSQRVWPNNSGTFDRVWSNALELRKAGVDVGFLAVIHDPVNYLKVFRFFIDNGLRSFRINYSAYIGRATEELEFPHGRAETFARHYLKMVDEVIHFVTSTGLSVRIRDLDNQLNNIITKKRPFMCYRSPCGCGNSILGFGQDGGIYACEEATGNDEFRIGNIFEDKTLTDVVDYSEQLKKINARTVENIPKCKDCLFKRFCGARCTTKSYARFGNFHREDPMCRFYQIIYPELIWRIHENPEIIPLLNPNFNQSDQLEDEQEATCGQPPAGKCP